MGCEKSYLERTKRNLFWMGGEDGQLALQSLRVGIAGLGGMGSNIAEIFVRLGVVNLKLADPDTIELSNLNRQVIANLNTIGKAKLAASVEELKGIEPNLNLMTFPEGIQKNNVSEFVQDVDVIINEIDVLHVQEQLWLLDAARERGIPVYTTLVVGVGIRLFKYDPKSSFTPREFLDSLVTDPSLERLISTFAEPLPPYLKDQNLEDFKSEIKNRAGIPIFGASTFLGQSLLSIRVLSDLGFLRKSPNIPETPSLPEFLHLDPLTLEIKKEFIKGYEPKTSN